MAKFRIEIQITFLALIIAGAVIGSGYLVYESLSEIVNSVHKAALPDNRLLVIKDIDAGLAEVENHVRLGIVTSEAGTTNKQYLLLRNSVYSDLRKLNSLNPIGIDDRQLADSIITISHLKLENWNNVLELYESTKGAKPAFNELYSKLEKQKIDTIKTERPKRGFFRSIFGTNKTEIDTQLVVRDIATNEIREELEKLEAEWEIKGQQFNVLESKYIEKNLELNDILNDLELRFESHISERLLAKTNEADRLAAETNKRLIAFSATAVVLLLIVLSLLYSYLRKSRRYAKGLKAAKAEAENFAKAKEQFAANVSHEIRTPINAIYGLSEQILQKDLDKNTREQMGVLAKSAFHLKNIVNDTLDFSKIQANKLKLETIHFAPSETFNEIIAILRSDARAKGLELHYQNNENLPEALIGDPLRLKQILLNLINNSLKFTESGYIKLLVEAESSYNKKVLLKMLVEDTGIGISEEDQKIVFDEFVQAENFSQKKVKGTGLGLSIVKKLVELQDGNISIESTLGTGTKISLEIPYNKGDVSKIEEHFSPIVKIPEALKQISVLIADDEEFNRFLLKGIFEKWGVSFSEAENGKDAITSANKGNYDLILMDLNMPGKNGADAAREILSQKPEIKILGITASTHKDDLETCLNSGMVGTLTKPFTEADLFHNISALFNGRNQQNEQESAKPEGVNLNLEELKRLTNNDENFLKEMLEIFLRSSEAGLNEIKSEIKVENYHAIMETAHKMASPCKHIQAKKLHAMLIKLEEQIKQNNIKNLGKLIHEIELEIIQTNKYIRDYLRNGQ